MRSTRDYSKKQEERIAQAIGGRRTSNSGATAFDKGDVKGFDILIEAKTLTRPQKSQTIQKGWIDKLEEEALARGKVLYALAIDFGTGEDYFVLDKRTFLRLYRTWQQSVQGAQEEA